MAGIITVMLVEAITTVASMEVMTEGLRQLLEAAEAVEASNTCRGSKPNFLKHS
jgi:hypothetical protein